jgi:DNA-binding response OmpR family regulator
MHYKAELTDEGYEVLPHGHVDMLMEGIEKEKPDLMVMELKMGGSDGLQLIEQVPSTYKQLPVICYPRLTHRSRSIRNTRPKKNAS